MSKTITITIDKGAVIESIKGDTSITGNIDRSVDPMKNAAVAYNEQAGNDAYHEKKLDLLIKTAVSKFEAEIAEFADGSTGSIDDTITSTTITITLVVSDRFNGGMANPLAGLAQSYIVNMSLFGWWTSIKPDFAKGFATLASDALIYVRKCFTKTAPGTSTTSYDDVTGSVTEL
jgi:hypothetical protein